MVAYGKGGDYAEPDLHKGMRFLLTRCPQAEMQIHEGVALLNQPTPYRVLFLLMHIHPQKIQQSPLQANIVISLLTDGLVAGLLWYTTGAAGESIVGKLHSIFVVECEKDKRHTGLSPKRVWSRVTDGTHRLLCYRCTGVR